MSDHTPYHLPSPPGDDGVFATSIKYGADTARAVVRAIDEEMARVASQLGLTPDRLAACCDLRTVTDADSIVSECVAKKYGTVLFRVRTRFVVTKETVR